MSYSSRIVLWLCPLLRSFSLSPCFLRVRTVDPFKQFPHESPSLRRPTSVNLSPREVGWVLSLDLTKNSVRTLRSLPGTGRRKTSRGTTRWLQGRQSTVSPPGVSRVRVGGPGPTSPGVGTRRHRHPFPCPVPPVVTGILPGSRDLICLESPSVHPQDECGRGPATDVFPLKVGHVSTPLTLVSVGLAPSGNGSDQTVRPGV